MIPHSRHRALAAPAFEADMTFWSVAMYPPPQHSITHDVSYLPTLDPRDSPSACQKSLLWEHGARNLQSTMASMGSARACRDREPLSVEMAEGLLPFAPSMHGLGFNLHYVTHMMGWGLASGRMPVLVESRELGEWTYGKHPDCDSEGWHCFFQPLSPCDTYSTSILASFPDNVHDRSAGIPRIALTAPVSVASDLVVFLVHIFCELFLPNERPPRLRQVCSAEHVDRQRAARPPTSQPPPKQPPTQTRNRHLI